MSRKEIAEKLTTLGASTRRKHQLESTEIFPSSLTKNIHNKHRAAVSTTLTLHLEKRIPMMLIILRGFKWSVQTSPTFHTDLQDQGNRFAARRSTRNHHLVMRCRYPNGNLYCSGLHVCGWGTVCKCFSSMWSQTSVEMAFFRPQHAPLVSVTSKLKKRMKWPPISLSRAAVCRFGEFCSF